MIQILLLTMMLTFLVYELLLFKRNPTEDYKWLLSDAIIAIYFRILIQFTNLKNQQN